MLLEDIFVMIDDFDLDQKHIEVVFLFFDAESDKCHEYSLGFHSGMPLEHFQKFMKAVGEKMQIEMPTLCGEEK